MCNLTTPFVTWKSTPANFVAAAAENLKYCPLGHIYVFYALTLRHRQPKSTAKLWTPQPHYCSEEMCVVPNYIRHREMFDNTKVTQNFLFWKRKRSFFFRVYFESNLFRWQIFLTRAPPHLPVKQNIKYRVSFEETFSCTMYIAVNTFSSICA